MSAGEKDGLELLRAIAHARMYVTSGRGVESVVHRLANGELGHVSKMLKPALHQMEKGESSDTAMRTLIDREENPNYRAFLSALNSSGAPAVQRLDELSNALHAEREARAEVYGARLTGIIDMTAALFVFAFAPTLVRVLTLIPPNKLIPTLTLTSMFEWVFYSILAIALTGLLYFSRIK